MAVHNDGLHVPRHRQGRFGLLQMAVRDPSVLEDDLIVDEFVVVFEGFDAKEDQGAEDGDALVKFVTLEIAPS